MAKSNYPLNVLHGYTAGARAIGDFCADLQKVDLDQLPAIGEISRERKPLLVYGALVLGELIQRTGAARLVVSTSGVREGVLFSQLPAALQQQDALITAARALSDLHARAPAHADELIAWLDEFMQDAFPQESAAQRRIRHAACLVSEVAWRANPDYRAEEAARMIAYAALPAIDHRERAFLASVQHARYEGLNENVPPPLRALLTLREIDEARLLGCLIRVAYNVSAGQPGVLAKTPLRLVDGKLVQFLPAAFADLSNERLVGRLRQSAKMLGTGFEIRVS